MNAAVLTFLSITALALLVVPRRWAPLPFIAAASYLSVTQVLEVGPFDFTVVRILIAVGVIRVSLRGERLVGGMNGLDWWIVLYCLWACVSSVFTHDPVSSLIFRTGQVYNTAGMYFLLRVFCTSIEDVIRLSQATALLLAPVALEMLYETTGKPNLFYLLEGRHWELFAREGRVRAWGPFSHPILAGTIGAVSLPLMIGIWAQRRKTACVGLLACLLMIVSSASSGPVLSAMASLGAVWFWRFRYLTRPLRRLTVVGYALLALVMNAPVYYLLARIDLAGGSTGWHRAKVIDSAIIYLGEWWLAGTENTRHWAAARGWSENHTDITNQYVYLGVIGGLPMMVLFIMALAKAFSFVGQGIRKGGPLAPHNQFMLWTLGSALFAHAVTFLSVSYFDQSFVFLYLTLAAIGSARAHSEQPVADPVIHDPRPPKWRELRVRGAAHPKRHGMAPAAPLSYRPISKRT